MDLVLAMTMATLVALAVVNARISGIEAERLHSEAESFTSILRALSRSLSPDAVVESIVHELGTATQADHVAVVRLQPGASVLDVTFVSMLPGAPTSNMVMPIRQVEAVETRHVRDLASLRPADAHLRLADNDPIKIWHIGPDSGLDTEGFPAPDRSVRSRPRGSSSAEDEARARQVADRIAHRLRESYGLRNTLAAPLQVGRSIAGAIVLSRRTEEVWPVPVIRLLNAAAAEASAALARVY